ncbi:MAG TPA: ABC transporter substrate-binding protein [Candidatus Udaeobacter sp.]|nr:ABC transporter substrate-binding protein [Candidatus Udaeobacter sp.]
MNRFRGIWLIAGLVAAATVVAACGSTASNTPGTTSKGTLTVGGFNFPESSILAEIYGQALAHKGYTINYKLLLGTREVVAPALKSGQIDLYPGYAATDLEYWDQSKGLANGDITQTAANLNQYLSQNNLLALTPAAAVDTNAFAMTKANAQHFNVTKLSDLAAIGGQLVLGAGPECPTRPYCLPGLQSTYSIHFKDFKALDTDGPLTRAAFKSNTIQVGLVFSSDGDLNANSLVVLQDDKHLEAADNIVPILRQSVASDDVKSILNNIDSHLTTADLVTMNSQVSIQHQDADAVAKAYLQQHNYFA